MRARRIGGLFSPNGQIRLMGGLFTKARVRKRFNPAKDPDVEKIWMRKAVEGKMRGLVTAKTFGGIDLKLRKLIEKRDADGLVREIAKRRGSESRKTLAKAKQDAIRLCERISAKIKEMRKANFELKKLCNDLEQKPRKTEKDMERLVLIKNAKDGFASALTVSGFGVQKVLSDLSELPY